MEELRVPKRATRVDVPFAGGTTSEVEVYLADIGEGREHLSDLLEGVLEFLPARAADGGATALLRRASIAVATVDAGVETAGPTPVTTPTEQRVTVHLVDGSSLSGVVRYVLAGESSRVLDHLNESTRFFAVWSGSRVALVAKAHVASVIPS